MPELFLLIKLSNHSAQKGDHFKKSGIAEKHLHEIYVLPFKINSLQTSYQNFNLRICITFCLPDFQCERTALYNPRSLPEEIVTRSLEGGQSDPPPLLLSTQFIPLSETTWCLIGFHGNNSQINDVTGGRHLGFLNFQILFKFSLFYLKLTRKQHLAVEIHEIGRIHCEVVSI